MREIFDKRGVKTSDKSAKLVADGYHGRKNRKGFYKYEHSSARKKEVNSEIYSFFGGPERGSMETHYIQERVVLMLVSEAVHCLQEGMLESAVDGDLGAVLGVGCPPLLGGPCRHIDRVGAS